MIAKQIQDTNEYELYTIVQSETPDGETIDTINLVGVATLEMLESEKNSLLEKISLIDEKISAINNA